MKDWKGNKNSAWSTAGVSRKDGHERETHDFYATDPKAVRKLLEKEDFLHDIWEPAAGMRHLSDELERLGHSVRSSDIIMRTEGVEQLDFLDIANTETWYGDIITNPPFVYAQEFIMKSLQLLREGNKLALFLKLQFLEGKGRKEMFRQFPPKTIYVFSERIICAKNGNFGEFKSSAICYAWFVWEKGYKGDTTIKWI